MIRGYKKEAREEERRVAIQISLQKNWNSPNLEKSAGFSSVERVHS